MNGTQPSRWSALSPSWPTDAQHQSLPAQAGVSLPGFEGIHVMSGWHCHTPNVAYGPCLLEKGRL